MIVELVYSAKSRELEERKDGAVGVMLSPALAVALGLGIGSRVQINAEKSSRLCSVVFLEKALAESKTLRQHKGEKYVILGEALARELGLKPVDERDGIKKYPPVYVQGIDWAGPS